MTTSLFDTVFDVEIAREAEEMEAALNAAAPPTPEELEALLSQARHEGYLAGKADGVSEGKAEAAASYDAKFSEAIQGIVEPLNLLLADERKHQLAIENDLYGLLRSLCEKCIPNVIAKFGDEFVDTEIRRIIMRAQGSRWLEVRINPMHRENVRLVLDAMVQPDGEKVQTRIIDDARMGLTEIQASWHNGRSTYSYEKICENVMDSLFGAEEPLNIEVERQDVE